MDVIGHNNRYVQPNPRKMIRYRIPTVSNDLSYSRGVDLFAYHVPKQKLALTHAHRHEVRAG